MYNNSRSSQINMSTNNEGIIWVLVRDFCKETCKDTQTCNTNFYFIELAVNGKTHIIMVHRQVGWTSATSKHSMNCRGFLDR